MEFSKKISVIDYVVFGISLLIPVLIAVYYTFVRKQKSNASFLLGDRALSALPISFSLAVSYLSAVTITGIPGEIAYHGWLFPFTWLLSSTLALLTVGNLFIPIFYKMKLTSVYEYLELRYQSRAVRLLASISYSLSILLYMGVVLYASCLALHTITDLSIIALILIGGFIGTIYTVMGGMKTVVWTDLFQALVMITGMVSIIVRGSSLAGGMKRVWEVGVVTQRIEWANWDPSPFSRNTTLGIFCGQFILWGSIFGCHQTQVQRYCATKSLQQARWALLISVALLWILTGCAIIAGLVIYATYWSCDPQSLGLIDKKDELVTFFVLDHLLHFYGLPGLFIASLLSGSLSTMSSGLNSLAAVIWEDVLKQMSWAQNISDKQQVMVTRGLAALAGVITVGLAILTSSGIEGVLQLGNTAMSVLAGPLLALFLLGFFTHTANRIGAISGLVVANLLTLWLLIGSFVYRSKGPNTKLTTYTEGCITQESYEDFGDNTTATALIRSNVFLDVHAIVNNRTQNVKPFFYIPDGDWQTVLYSTSYHLYALIGFIVCLLVCLIVSMVSRMFLKFKDVEPLLLHPLVRNRSRCKCCQNSEIVDRNLTNGSHYRNHLHTASGRRHFQLGGHNGPGNDWDEMNYYNRWPSPSLPPTLKKNHKTESKASSGLHLDGGFPIDDDPSNGVTIIAPSDDDSEINFQSVSSSNNNNNINHITKKSRKTSASNGTLDRIDLGMNRQGVLDSMSLNSMPVIVNTNNNTRGQIHRTRSKYERGEHSKLNDSFSSTNPHNFGRRDQILSARKLVRKSESENEDLTSELEKDDDFSLDYTSNVRPLSSPSKLNGRKIEIIHNRILKRHTTTETVSDEDGWTTDF